MFKEVNNQEDWDRIVAGQGGHPLQLWAWGELKAAHGPWTPTRIAFENRGAIIGGAQILTRKLPKPFGRMFYIPRGPFCGQDDQTNPRNRAEILKNLAEWAKEQAKEQGGVVLKIEPDWLENQKFPDKSWRKSKNHVQLPRTLRLNLAKTDDKLLAEMSKKTRQYIRKSENDGVEIRRISDEKDLKAILKIYHETAARDHFALHDDDYYLDLAKFAGENNQVFLAEKAGRPLAFLWNLAGGETCFELYGGVNREGQDLRANYALKWHAIRAARQNGAAIYDLNGLLNDGVSNFKRGWSDQETNLVGTWDLPLSPLYFAWEKLLPTAKKAVQRLDKRLKRSLT